VSREILIQTQKGERLVAIVEDGQVDDFHIEVDRYQSLLGNIYKGRVESVLPSINAAFINIGQERNGFLYLTDVVTDPMLEPEVAAPAKIINKILGRGSRKPAGAKKGAVRKSDIPFKVGQEILVQVVKDPFGEKGGRLTTHVTLPGRFVVYMPFDKNAGVSKKIENPEERQRLREVIQEFSFARMGGFIIRTASLQQGKRELVRDAKFLYEMWMKIYSRAEKQKAPALIYEEGELTWKIVRDYLTDKIDRLVIDNAEDYEKIKKFVQTLIGKEMVERIEHYKGRVPLFEHCHIDKDLHTIYETHVHVKTGAYIVIEPTEGLTVVDVNSGRFKVKASPEQAAFMVNMEVVPEIARQLRLRDLGGIIVIDFIDMSKEENRRKVHEALVKALSRDHAKTEVFRISQLGLVEMTRARTGKTIESISFGPCPYCNGRGRVKIV
jgi:ribonuclease G